jgi:Tannase and feruloyl esterase
MTFDPAALLCRGGADNDCLTAPQVEAVKMGYAPARKKTGELIYPGLVPGGETGWAMLTGANPEPGGIDVGMFRYVAHEDPAWDWRTFDVDRDSALIKKKAGFIDATNPDLSAFRARGEKLIIYHGWNDGGSGGAISPQNSVNYYSSVLARMGPQQQEWLRLFIVPGMAHCGGGPGPNQVNWMVALERWRESGIAPDQLIASRVSDNRVNMTRPICPIHKSRSTTASAARTTRQTSPARCGECLRGHRAVASEPRRRDSAGQTADANTERVDIMSALSEAGPNPQPGRREENGSCSAYPPSLIPRMRRHCGRRSLPFCIYTKP